MAGNKALVPILVGMMCLTGVTNTILTKLQDKQCVADCDGKNPKYFEAPVLQTLLMFVGEAGCWLVIFMTSLVRKHTMKGNAKITRTDYSAVAASEEEESVLAEDEDDEEGQYTAMSSSQTLVDPTNLPAKALIDGEQSNRHREALTGRKVFLLALPAICDIIATTLMNVGLLFVAASIFQMTRGALVLFVGLLSVIFLKKHLGFWKWTSLFIVVGGVAIVGLAGVLAQKPKEQAKTPDSVMLLVLRSISDSVSMTEAVTTASSTVFGIVLIAAAQIFAATQFVLEESIMERYTMDPIQVVSFEGTFGLVITGIGMGILHAVIGRTSAGAGGYFDARETFHILFTNRIIGIASLFYMFSIAGFNFFGLSVTRQISATARSTIDTFRVLFIWLVSLGLGWESFKWLQVLGFAMLVYGTGIFNEIISPPTLSWLRKRTRQNGPVRLDSDT